MIEHQHPNAPVCVMEYDQSGSVHPPLAPSLAIPVVGALLGLPVGPDRGPAAGGSIHRLIGQVHPDVALDSAFESLASVLAENCIRACWSMPIRSPPTARCWALSTCTARCPESRAKLIHGCLPWRPAGRTRHRPRCTRP